MIAPSSTSVVGVNASEYVEGREEGTLDGGSDVQQGKMEGENASIIWAMIKQVSCDAML